MCILDLLAEAGIQSKRLSSAKGGEYHSPCPHCGGRDRFIVWPEADQYWCRRCDLRGDGIQFCRDVLNMTFEAARIKLGIARERNAFPKSHKTFVEYKWEPKIAVLPNERWTHQAEGFLAYCQKALLNSEEALNHLYERGFTKDTIVSNQLGWNPVDVNVSKSSWGVEVKEGDRPTIWFPRGIVISGQVEGQLAKLRIRRIPTPGKNKYIIVSGSGNCSLVFGDISLKKGLILESELDAMLINQFAGDLCYCVALGNAQARPDKKLDELLKCSKIIYSLDFDDSGKKEYSFWKKYYPHILPWVSDRGKSPGDDWKMGVDLRAWVREGFDENRSATVHVS